VVVVVLEDGSCFSLFVADVDSPLVSRNKSHPLPPAASIPFPPFPCCRSFHPVISDPAGFEVDLRPSCLDQTPSWADLLPTIVSRHLSSPAESPTVTATASPSQQSQILEPDSSKRRPCLWYLLDRVASPWDPGASCFIYLRRRYNHIYRLSVRSSDRGFTGPLLPTLCAVSAWVYASMTPLRSPRRRLLRLHRHGLRRLVPLGFQAFCVFWSSSEDFYVIWLL
jgi:hypothetical protein